MVGRYYPRLSESGQTVTYTYNFDPLIFSGFYDHSYSFSNITNQSNSSEQAGAVISWPLNIKKWTYIPSIAQINENINDVVSSRKVEKRKLSQVIQTQKTFFDDFVQAYSFKIDMINQKTKGFSSFWGIELLKKFDLKITEKLKTHLRISYGKLDKKGFSSGVLYGGSSAYLGGESNHEFYGVFYSDVFGNEVTSARVQLDYLFREVYRGSGLFPLYIKEFRWLLGADYIKANKIILKDKVLTNQGISSVHLGARFKTTIAYLAPINVDLLYVKLLGEHASSQDDESSVLFLLSSSLF